VALDDLQWADPDSDGELMGRYFDLTDKGGLPAIM